MSRSENESFAKRVFHFYQNGGEKCIKTVVEHFASEGKHTKCIYRILSKFLETGNDSYKVFPGRTPVVSSPRKVEKVKKAFEKNPNASLRKVARKLGISKSTISYIKDKKLGIREKQKKKSPKYVKDPENRPKTGLRKIYKKTREKVLIIDDVTFDPCDIPARQFYHCVDP